jgi:hypothetical protein
MAASARQISTSKAVRAKGQNGTTAFTFIVRRTGDDSAAHSASWKVSGDAVDGADFVGGALSGKVVFAVGEVSKTITVKQHREQRGEALADRFARSDGTHIRSAHERCARGNVVFPDVLRTGEMVQ